MPWTDLKTRRWPAFDQGADSARAREKVAVGSSRERELLADLRRRSDELKRRSDELERRSDELSRQAEEMRQDWRRKRADPGVPGARPSVTTDRAPRAQRVATEGRAPRVATAGA